MENPWLELLEKIFDKIGLPFIIALVGAVIHTFRTKDDPNNNSTFFSFFMLIIINISIVMTIGIVAEDYFEVKNNRLIWVISGLACTFSMYILNLIQYIIQDIAPDVARKFFNVDKEN